MRSLTWEAESATNASNLILARAIALDPGFDPRFWEANGYRQWERQQTFVHWRIVASFSIFQTWLVGAVIHHPRCRWSTMSFFNIHNLHNIHLNYIYPNMIFLNDESISTPMIQGMIFTSWGHGWRWFPCAKQLPQGDRGGATWTAPDWFIVMSDDILWHIMKMITSHLGF